MQVHESPANSQSETEAAELPRNVRVPLLKGVKNPRQDIRLNPHPGIAHLNQQPMAEGVLTMHAHAAAVHVRITVDSRPLDSRRSRKLYYLCRDQ